MTAVDVRGLTKRCNRISYILRGRLLVEGTPAGIVASQGLAAVTSLENTGYYRFEHVADSAAEAEALLTSGAVSFVVTIPSDFDRRVMRGNAPQILFEADATDPAVSSGAISPRCPGPFSPSWRSVFSSPCSLCFGSARRWTEGRWRGGPKRHLHLEAQARSTVSCNLGQCALTPDFASAECSAAIAVDASP